MKVYELSSGQKMKVDSLREAIAEQQAKRRVIDTALQDMESNLFDMIRGYAKAFYMTTPSASHWSLTSWDVDETGNYLVEVRRR